MTDDEILSLFRQTNALLEGHFVPNFGAPFFSLVKLNVETFEADKLPPDLAATAAIKPGSK